MKSRNLFFLGFIGLILITACTMKTDTKQVENDYYHSKVIAGDYDTIVKKVTESLKLEGFGVVSKIDIQEKLNEKLDVDYKKYLILGACNPQFAYEALEMENKIGTMLPCNIIIQEMEENTFEVAVINPESAMSMIGNPELQKIAKVVKEKLNKAVDNLE